MQQLVIVGLGNPGSQYEYTRHNLGIRAVKTWLGSAVSWHEEPRFQAAVAQTNFCTALFPLTFMNNSGVSVASFLNFKKLTPQQLIIVHDEVELSLGEVRWKEQGSAAGHNGVRSLIEALGTDQFKRLRLGIGRPPENMPLDRFVLENFTDTEKEILIKILHTACAELSATVPRQSPE